MIPSDFAVSILTGHFFSIDDFTFLAQFSHTRKASDDNKGEHEAYVAVSSCSNLDHKSSE